MAFTRHPEQTFWIGEDVEVKVLAVDGNAIRIGVMAPEEIKVFRGELLKGTAGPTSSDRWRA